MDRLWINFMYLHIFSNCNLFPLGVSRIQGERLPFCDGRCIKMIFAKEMLVPVLCFKMALRQLSPAFMHLCILNVSTIWFIHVLYIWGNCGSKGTKFMYVLHVILSKLWKQGYAVHVYIAYVLVTSKFQNDYDLTSILLSKEWLCIISDIFLFINHKNLLNFVHIKLSRLSSINEALFSFTSMTYYLAPADPLMPVKISCRKPQE